MSLLDEHGASDCRTLLPLKADALLCGNEPERALEASTTALSTRADSSTAISCSSKADTEDELMLRNNRACLLVAMGRLADAETELLCCIRLAPSDVAPVYNLTLLLWMAGEKRRASQQWLRFREYPYQNVNPADYERYAGQVSRTCICVS